MTAIKKAPKAIDPRWYLKTHQRPVRNEPLPFESEVQEKYHRATEAEIMNYVHPMIKAFIQRSPKSEYRKTY